MKTSDKIVLYSNAKIFGEMRYINNLNDLGNYLDAYMENWFTLKSNIPYKAEFRKEYIKNHMRILLENRRK